MSFDVSFVNRLSKRDSFSCSYADAVSCEGSRSLFGSPHTSRIIVCPHLPAIEPNLFRMLMLWWPISDYTTSEMNERNR